MENLKIRDLLFIICTILSLFSCKNDTENIKIINNKSTYDSLNLKLIKVDSLKYPLDSFTTCINLAYKLIEFKTDRSEVRMISLLNDNNNSIYFYDYDKYNLYKKINLNNSNEIGLAAAQSFNFISWDSIYILSRTKLNLFHIDSSSYVHNNYSLEMFDSPRARSNVPMVKEKDYIYISNYLNFNYNNPVPNKTENLVIKLNLTNESTSTHLSYPKKYVNKIWVPIFLQYTHAYNKFNKSFIFSFLADDNVYVTNHDNIFDTYFMGSKYFNNIKAHVNQRLQTDDQRLQYFTNDSYHSIYFDKYRKLYYRIALQKIPKDIYLNDQRKINKKASMIIYDLYFNRICELMLPDNIVLSSLMFTKEGINIVKIDFLDEDNLTLLRFKLDSI